MKRENINNTIKRRFGVVTNQLKVAYGMNKSINEKGTNSGKIVRSS